MTVPGIFQFLRRHTGAIGSPTTLKSGQPFVNEVENVLYMGVGDDGTGASTAQIAMGGAGAFIDMASSQTISGQKTFGASPIAPTPSFADISERVATTRHVKNIKNPLYFYGFVGDGVSRPISGIALFAGLDSAGWTLAQWQSAVPQIGALTDEIDGVAIQAALNAQNNNIYGNRIDLPANCQARLSRTIQSFGNLIIEGNGSRLIAVGATFSPIIQHGTSASPRSGEVHVRGLTVFCNGGTGFDAYFASSVGAGSGKTVDFKDSTFINCGAPGFRLINAPRTIDIGGVTLWTSAYTLGAGFLFQASQYASGSNGASFSYTLVDCQTSGFQTGYEFDIVATTSPSSYGSAGGVMEGVVIYSCRAYNGQGFLKVTNTYNSGTSFNYGSPLWTIRDCDYQCFGNFADLSGLTNVIIDGCWIALDEGGVGGNGQPAALSEVDVINLAFCNGVIIQNNNFSIFSTDTKSTNKCIKTDANTSNVLIQDNNLAADIAFDCFVHYAATTAANGAYTNIERRTTLTRTNLPTVWCRDDGGNQVSEGRVKLLGGRLTTNNRTQYVLTNSVVSVGAGGIASIVIPSGLFRQNPQVVSAFNGNFGAYGFPVAGFRSDYTSLTGVAIVFGLNGTTAPTTGTNNAAVNIVIEGN